MLFTRKGRYYSEAPGGYRVTATLNNGIWKFTGWHYRNIIDAFLKSEDAYESCRTHYLQNNSADGARS